MFSAAHKLSRADWSEEKNKEVFGKCSNPNWHGHNYTLYVTVKGNINPETGFVVNLSEVSQVLKKYILDKVDHKNLNLEVDFLQGKLCSTEMLAIEFWKELEAPIRAIGSELHCIKIQETDKNSAEYFG